MQLFFNNTLQPSTDRSFLTTNELEEAQYKFGANAGYISDGDPTTTQFLSTSKLVFFNNVPGTVALFHLHNSATFKHYFTTNPSVFLSALASGYTYEGLQYCHIVGYFYVTRGCPGAVLLYWEHSDALSDNHYTVLQLYTTPALRIDGRRAVSRH
jgi:hypothetical protein